MRTRPDRSCFKNRGLPTILRIRCEEVLIADFDRHDGAGGVLVAEERQVSTVFVFEHAHELGFQPRLFLDKPLRATAAVFGL